MVKKKKLHWVILLCVCFLPILLHAQNYLDMPEGISYDSVSESYFVSCWNPACVVKIDSLGNQSIFKSGLNACANNVLVDSILYVSYRYGVKAFNINTGVQVLYKPISANNYFDGIAYHDGYLYLINHGQKLYKIDLSDNSHELLASTGLGNYPQGLIYDEVNDRLLSCSFQNSAPIVAIDPETGQTSYALWTGLNNLDALAQDQWGNIYVTCNGTSSVYRYDSNLENRIVVSSGHSGPSGLEYNRDENILAISNFFTDVVDFVSMSPYSVDVPEIEGTQLHQNFPNPVTTSTTFRFRVNRASEVGLFLYDSRGRFLDTLIDGFYPSGSHEFVWNSRNNSSHSLSSGTYYVLLKNNEAEFVKKISVIR